MKHTYTAIILILVIGTVMCTSRSLKPRPSGHGWVRCEECGGYGTIALYTDRATSHRNRGGDESIGSCLQNLFGPGWGPVDENRPIERYTRDVEQEKRMNTFEDPYGPPPGRNFRVEYVPCNICKGNGWIQKDCVLK
ncbi:MAG TPA: hypothetical protein PK544_17755 [Spirochaetota bacterium]|nr:hypothetical protein [Spirochaetota bacterium]